MKTSDLETFWVLNLAAEYPAPLEWIIPTYADTSFNIPECPTLQPQQRADLVRQLIAEGALALSRGPSTFPNDLAGEVIQSRLTGAKTDRYSLRLTPAGALRWEKSAEPRWGDYVKVESDYETGMIASANLDRVVAYLGWFGTLNPEEEILSDTITIGVRDGYPLTYWREVDRVYVALFECRHRVDGAAPAESSWLRAWRFGLSNWHIRPWDLEAWPKGHRDGPKGPKGTP